MEPSEPNHIAKAKAAYDFGDEPSETDSNISEDRHDSRTEKFSKAVSRKRKLSASTIDSGLDSNHDDDSLLEAARFKRTHGPHEDTQSMPPQTQTASGTTEEDSLPATKSSSKHGVIYISRIPPYLKPHTLRQMISIHGPVTNLFLTPEPPTAYHHRVRTHHGNKKRQYIDGWVEFKHRRHARACVDALNGKTTAEGLGVGAIGGRKGGKGRWYRDDVWTVRYLQGFSWDDLMQSTRTEEREREERIRFGLVKEKKERQAFLDGVQHAKVEKTRQAKKKRKPQDGKHADGESSQRSAIASDRLGEKGFQQSEPRKRQDNATGGDATVQRVLRKIF